MKKMTILAVVILFFCTFRAEAQAFEVGTNVISAGLGLGSTLNGYGYSSSTPGINFQYERGIWEAGPGVISLGGYLGFKGYKYSSPDFQEKWNYTVVGVRGAYHLTGLDIENLDLYGGAMLSYNNLSFSYHDYSGSAFGGGNYNSAVGASLFVGGRYYFAGNLSGFAELGFGLSILSVGLAYKF